MPAYGMSETASGCVYAGRPLDGVRVRLAGQDERGVGRIELAGPVLAHGYRLAPDLTAAAFADGWFHTGDAGRVTDGRLDVLGRTDDLINTGGVKVAPAAVEQALAGGARCTGRVCGGSGRPAVGAGRGGGGRAHRPGRPAAGGHAGGSGPRAGGQGGGAQTIRLPDRLPLRGPGKLDRTAVRDLFGEC